MNNGSELSAPQIGAVLGGRYRLMEIIGEGGMGMVFRAEHVVTQRSMAVKLIRPRFAHDAEILSRFRNEARASGRIDHPNVVAVHDFGVDPSCGAPYLVMDYLRGEPFSAVLARRGSLPLVEALGALLPVMRGLEAAHRLGVVHRDLKPENIFLTRHADGSKGPPKVLDFGVSKLSRDLEWSANSVLTAHGAVMGTPYYMSPEQTRSARDVDPRSDVYSMGVVLYEALSGQRPFERDSFAALVVAIASEEPPRLDSVAEIPAAVADVVHATLAKEPRDRPDSIRALAMALEPFAGGDSFELWDSPPPKSGAPPMAFAPTALARPGEVRSPALRAGVVALALLGFLGAGAWWWQEWQRGSETAEEVSPTDVPAESAEETRAASPVADEVPTNTSSEAVMTPSSTTPDAGASEARPDVETVRTHARPARRSRRSKRTDGPLGRARRDAERPEPTGMNGRLNVTVGAPDDY